MSLLNYLSFVSKLHSKYSLLDGLVKCQNQFFFPQWRLSRHCVDLILYQDWANWATLGLLDLQQPRRREHLSRCNLSFVRLQAVPAEIPSSTRLSKIQEPSGCFLILTLYNTKIHSKKVHMRTKYIDF